MCQPGLGYASFRTNFTRKDPPPSPRAQAEGLLTAAGIRMPSIGMPCTLETAPTQ
jgi:hypothetical protein